MSHHRCYPPRSRPQGDVRAEVKQLAGAIRQLTKEIKRMSQELTDLTEEVRVIKDRTKAVVATIAGLRQAILDTKGEPAALKALTDSLHEDGEALAEAALEGTTPADPEQPV